MTLPDASAIARNLSDAGTHSLIVDASLTPLSADATAAATLIKSTSGGQELATSALIANLRKTMLSDPLPRAALLLRGIFQDRVRLRKLFASAKPAALVVFDDRRVRPDLVALQLARRRDIPTLIVPFAVSTLEADLHMRQGRHELEIGRTPYKKLKSYIAQRSPEQVQYTSDGRALLFFDPLETILLHRLGLLARPWVWGGGGADIVCALSEDHKKYLLDGGVEESRIALTGQPSLDALSCSLDERRRLKHSLQDRYRLERSRPLALCAVPQYGEHSMTEWHTHWRLIDELFASFAGTGFNILLSLHPKSKRTEYSHLAELHRIEILDERLVDVLPAADLLVGAFSSTINWAIGLSIPAVVVDALQSQFQLYRGLEGVTVVDSHYELNRTLARFGGDSDALAAIKAAAERGSARVGRIDGSNAKRVAEAVLHVMRKPSCTSAAELQ